MSQEKKDGDSVNLGYAVTEIYAYIADAGGGDEGIMGLRFGDTWMPLVAADRNRALRLRDAAMAAARRTKQTVRLVRFTQRENLETY